jgi:hypothetical protein
MLRIAMIQLAVGRSRYQPHVRLRPSLGAANFSLLTATQKMVAGTGFEPVTAVVS